MVIRRMVIKGTRQKCRTSLPNDGFRRNEGAASASIAADDCALFMWATFPTLPDALALGAAWGFTYKTVAFVWAKTVPRTRGKHTFMPVEDDCNYHMGMGYWTRANTEPCFLFTRGKPQRVSKGVRQLIVAPVQEHSRKPDEQYARMEALIQADVRVELFARRTRPGWHSFGNEITGNDLALDIAQFAALE